MGGSNEYGRQEMSTDTERSIQIDIDFLNERLDMQSKEIGFQGETINRLVEFMKLQHEFNQTTQKQLSLGVGK